MLSGMFGPSSIFHALRKGLDDTMQSHKAIADRVAGGASGGASGDFAGALDAAKGKLTKRDEMDLQHDMAELADTQIRYEAESKLLHGAYSGIRTAIRERN